jgi:HEAT repeat protein
MKYTNRMITALVAITVVAAGATAQPRASFAGAGGNAGRAARTNPLPSVSVQGDPAEATWRDARRALADEDWQGAAQGFAKVRASYPRSAYVADSYYWQAWALYQKGGSSAMRQAAGLLDTQRSDFAAASTVKSGEAQRLSTRIRGELAQSGDAEAAEEVVRRAGAAVGRNGGAAGSAASRGSGQGRGSCPSEENDDRVMALNALLQMRSDDALPILKQVLAKRDACSEVLRRKAVFLVSQKRSADAADILMDAAQNDPDAETREQAVFWLSQVGGDRATGLLEQILKTSKDETLQDKAIFALSQGRDPKRAQVLRDYALREDVAEHLREQAVFWIGQTNADENGKFLRDLFGRVKGTELRNKILFSLSQQRSDGNDQFLIDQAVNTQNAMEVRKQALFWAGQRKSIDVAQMATLYDKGGDTEFREQVIFVLSQRPRDAAAVDKLIDIAKTEKNRDLREKAIFWLGQSRDPKALKALSEIVLKSPE